ncbi:hypothetical protein KSF_058650 [Reticulibacter mediterranei]|uniref:Protein kinase domain-containing protein n=1 Tax=Reticulibacter mediterranei TaxID=2778369 RepID=A0A8J3IS22_9CHLR|nr:protein kinase [Reticulibacter mediterranei]GHO95817.1 hypothetical protein KSF_058650 [Reticulibacter mediterranei]
MSTSHLGAYELQHHLASDPASDMWKAFDREHHRFVMLKLLRFDVQRAPHFLPDFLHEAQHVKSLTHPHIASVFDVITLRTQPESPVYAVALVTEYVEDQSLAEYLQATARQGVFLQPVEMVRLLAPLASAIDYMHQKALFMELSTLLLSCWRDIPPSIVQ